MDAEEIARAAERTAERIRVTADAAYARMPNDSMRRIRDESHFRAQEWAMFSQEIRIGADALRGI